MIRSVELFAAAVLGGAVVLAGSHWLGDGSPGSEPAGNRRGESGEGATRAADANAPTQMSAEELRDALEREAMQRETLAAELELMRTVVEHLAAAQAAWADAADAAVSPKEAKVGAKAPKPAGLQFEEERLAELGMLEGEIADLRRLWDDAQLAKLDLHDRATREGWLMRPAHRKQAAQVEIDLRNRLGEEAYDDLLYATNQLNRTEVKQVLGGSAAARAGLQSGDQVMSYDGTRIFRPADLRAATSAGTRNEQVRVVVNRDGRSISVVVPRGPLGVLLNATSSPPR